MLVGFPAVFQALKLVLSADLAFLMFSGGLLGLVLRFVVELKLNTNVAHLTSRLDSSEERMGIDSGVLQ